MNKIGEICNYCTNSTFELSRGLECNLGLKGRGFVKYCQEYQRNEEKVLKQKKMIGRRHSFYRISTLEVLKHLLSFRGIKDDGEKVVIKESKMGMAHVLVMFLLLIFWGISILLIFDNFEDKAKAHFALIWMFVGFFPLLMLFAYNAPGLFKPLKEIISIDKKGISINGEFVEWRNYIGFVAITETNDQIRSREELWFHAIGGLKAPMILKSLLPISLKRLEKIIQVYQNKS